MENQYVRQYPDLMQGKKIMYVHGFGSSAQSGTVTMLRTLFPEATVVAEDIPLHPAEAMDMLEACGFDETAARAALAPLFLGNARHVAEAGPEKALTGPVERGDAATVEKHLAAFAEIGDEDDRALYRLLTKRLLRIAKAKHSERDFAAIEELVSQDV